MQPRGNETTDATTDALCSAVLSWMYALLFPPCRNHDFRSPNPGWKNPREALGNTFELP